MRSMPPPSEALTHRWHDVGYMRLHCVEAGEGPLVVLLHGFPEFWYSWRHQIPALAAAGLRVVAPDMRGYNVSGKPRGVDAYRWQALTGDVVGLVRACGEERASIVGHDWGGVVGWHFAMCHPEMLERLAILNAPHPLHFLRALATPGQLARSWYIGFFQLPWIPEAVLSARNFSVLRQMLARDPEQPGAFSPEDIERYVEACRQPGALTAALNYYRAAARQNPARLQRETRVVDAPVLVIWGEKERALGADLAEPPGEWVRNARVERLPTASHWVASDEPERVNALLIEFLTGPSRATPAASARGGVRINRTIDRRHLN